MNTEIINFLGKDVTIKNIKPSEVKNIKCGECAFENKIIKTYIIGKNVKENEFQGKIVSIIDMKENDEVRIVVAENESFGAYTTVKGFFKGEKSFKKAKFRCMYETSAGAVIYKIKNNEPYYLIIYSKKNIPGFPKGHVEYGENLKSAAKREIKEEVGINVLFKPNFKKTIFYTVFDTPIKKKVEFFLSEISEKEKINIDKDEINGYELLTFEQAKNLLNDDLMNVLLEAKKYIENDKSTI